MGGDAVCEVVCERVCRLWAVRWVGGGSRVGDFFAPTESPRSRSSRARPSPSQCARRKQGGMSSLVGKIKDIEDEMARTQINKQTMAHICGLRAKLARYKRELLFDAPKSGAQGTGEGFDVKATGDARVGLVGFPSVGKSTLLTSLTGIFSEAASYEFTTLTCIPGVIHHKGAKIQLLDLPGIIEGAKDGKGRGRQVISTARTCHCIIIVLDAMKPLDHKRIIERELEGVGIRLNKKPPAIVVTKKLKGGLNFSTSVKGVPLTSCSRIARPSHPSGPPTPTPQPSPTPTA